MSEIRDGFAGTIGNTPLIRLRRASEETGCEILGKAEFLNPGGSVKDRAAYGMIKGALDRGELQPGMRLIEATSGNTGIALAMIAQLRGYPIKILLPENVSIERRQLLEAFLLVCSQRRRAAAASKPCKPCKPR